MRKYTNINISNLHISPYISFYPEEDAVVIIWQRIFGCQIRIPGCTPYMMEEFVRSFRDGLDEEETKEQIRSCFPGSDPETVLEELMRAGVLE